MVKDVHSGLASLHCLSLTGVGTPVPGSSEPVQPLSPPPTSRWVTSEGRVAGREEGLRERGRGAGFNTDLGAGKA